MMRHIKIHTDFDITNTGVVRNYKGGMLPCKVGDKTITTEEEWTKLRRQQSNWETLIQMISLRTQPIRIRTTINKSDWTLEFDIESVDVYRKGNDPIGLLKEDIENVPLLTGLDEHKELEVEQTDGTPNVRFETYEL
jgi:hypothetical protein